MKELFKVTDGQMDLLITIGFPLIVDRAQIDRGYSAMQSLW